MTGKMQRSVTILFFLYNYGQCIQSRDLESKKRSPCPPQTLLRRYCDRHFYGITRSLRADWPQNFLQSPHGLRVSLEICQDYAAYTGCLLALTPNQHCWPTTKQNEIMEALAPTFCSTEIQATFVQFGDCINRIQYDLIDCQKQIIARKWRSDNNTSLTPPTEMCSKMLDLNLYSQCVKHASNWHCDNNAAAFFGSIRNQFLTKFQEVGCSQNDTNDEDNTDPDLKSDVEFQHLPRRSHDSVINIKPSLEIQLNKSRKKMTRKMYASCQLEQEFRAQECLKKVSTLPHTGINFKPDEWLVAMSNLSSRLIQESCNALEDYSNCLESRVFADPSINGTGPCSFYAWVPTHALLAREILCDDQIRSLMIKQNACLTQENTTASMRKCSSKGSIIVDLLRALYEDVDPAPSGDKLSDLIVCQMFTVIRSTYECLEDAIFENCGHDAILPVAKIKTNLLKFAMQEGCSMCSL